MKIVDMHDARTPLSRFVEAAARGKLFVIARVGRTLVKVERLAEGEAAGRRTGFLAGQGAVPSDFDRMGRDAIARSFGG